MVNLDLLKGTIEDSGLRFDVISDKSGISERTIKRRLKGDGEFTASEIMGLRKALNLNASNFNDIFFAKADE